MNEAGEMVPDLVRMSDLEARYRDHRERMEKAFRYDARSGYLVIVTGKPDADR